MNFCKVDLNHSKATISKNKVFMRRVFREYGTNPSTNELREFLSRIENANTKDNYIKSLRVYFRDFVGDFDRVKSFRFSNPIMINEYCPTKLELREFYGALDSPRERALFLMYAASGKRRNEILELTLDLIDLSGRVIMPTKESATKRTWYSFYNSEASDALQEYLKERRDVKRSNRVFVIGSEDKHFLFEKARKGTGMQITPKILRFWFSNEMARLKVQDRYIAALQGRIPRSVLARHYTDYSLEKLKATYEEAGLKVLA